MLTRPWSGWLAIGLALTFGASAPEAAEAPVEGPQQLAALVAEALANNPEIAAARSEFDAVQERASTAGALDDPMLEFGVINAPLDPVDLQREDMTMKMLGFEQRLPFPGKRDLRRAVAAADAASTGLAVQEVINRIERDVRVAYEELVFNAEAQKIVGRTRGALEQLAEIARSRYEVGNAAQNDVLDARIELDRLDARQLQLTSEDAALQGEIQRLLGRTGSKARISAGPPRLAPDRVPGIDSTSSAIENRPRLLALQSLVERNDSSIELAEREYYPDFDVKLQYGQRDRAPDGTPRDDMVSLTVAVNLPIWRKSRLEPQVAEARAMRRQAESMLAAERLESQAALETQVALARQWRATAELYQSTLQPQVHAAVTSALAAYRVGRVDFLTLRQSQMREFEVSTELARAVASHNKAIAEIDLLVGRSAAVEP
jgi:outer membrane protein TolC